MSSATSYRQRGFRCFCVLFRNFCSKNDEFDLSSNFKYSTTKLIREEKRNYWKNRCNNDPKANLSSKIFFQRDREIQNSKGSRRAEMMLDDEFHSSNHPEKYSKANDLMISRDLMEAELMPVNKRKTNVLSGVVRSQKEIYSGVKSKIVGEIVFGINPVSMALSANRRRFYQLFVKRNCAENVRLSAIQAQAESMHVPVVKVDVDKLNEMSGGRPHQGVCLDAGMLFFEMDEEKGPHDPMKEPLWILMDKIQDPMNLGAVLRSCYYFGVKTVFTVKQQTCKLTPVVSKASSGAMEMMNVHAIEHSSEFLRKKIKEGWNVIGSASVDALNREKMDPKRIVELNDFIWPKPTILLVGNEGSGIDSELIKYCNRIVTISRCYDGNPDMMSLNVSVATGIILQHCCSQLLQNSERSQSGDAIAIPAAIE